MKFFVTILLLFVAVVLVSGQISQGGPHSSQGGPHQNQGRIRRQADQSPANDGQDDGDDEQAGPNAPNNPQNWTSCDINAVPRISCHDCSTRLICKPIGGLLKSCKNPSRPHCNNGICSPVPSINCL